METIKKVLSCKSRIQLALNSRRQRLSAYFRTGLSIAFTVTFEIHHTYFPILYVIHMFIL